MHMGKLRQTIVLQRQRPGSSIKRQWLLGREGENKDYLVLHLWVCKVFCSRSY